MCDLISRQAAIKNAHFPVIDDAGYEVVRVDDILALPSAEQKEGWIPVIWHKITDEERNREGYPKSWVVYIDCEMPSDEQEILVTTRWGTVEADICYEYYEYDDGGFGLDSGYDWINDIIAWMPRPEPYRRDGEA